MEKYEWLVNCGRKTLNIDEDNDAMSTRGVKVTAVLTYETLDVEVDDDAVPGGGDGVVENLVQQHRMKLVKDTLRFSKLDISTLRFMPLYAEPSPPE